MATPEVRLAVAPGSTGSQPASWVARVVASFHAAVDRVGVLTERFYRVAGQPVCLQFAGPALIPKLTPALAHLATSYHAAPALTVCLWDSKSTATPMPPPPWTVQDYLPRGEIQGFNTDNIRVVYDGMSGSLSLFDGSNRRAVYWARDAGDVAYYESGAPLRAIFHWWMSLHGRQCVHAAAVGTSEGAALLVGKGGSGKSTTALACVEAGLSYVGDDYCLVTTDGTPYVSSLYSSAKLDGGNLWRFPRLGSHVSNAERLATEKAIVFLHQHQPAQTVAGVPVRAVLLPRIGGRVETRLAPARAADALLALAPSTVFQLGPAPGGLQAMSRLVRRVPCSYLHLGTDLSGVAEAVARAVTRS